MRMTTRGRYALRATLALSQLGKGGGMVSINTLSEAEDISSIFLEQIFFKLKKAGIVKSVRGPGGGFSFARPIDSFSVREILDAAGEELTVLPCDRSESECDRQSECIAHQVIIKVTEQINKYLDSLTLKMILENKEFRPAKKKHSVQAV